MVRLGGRGGGGQRSLRGGLGGDGGDTVLLEVGRHGRVAAQSLAGGLERAVALHDPGAPAGLLGQHAAAAAGAGGLRALGGAAAAAAAGRPFRLLLRLLLLLLLLVTGGGGGGGAVGAGRLQHAGDVVQEVVEELGHALVTWRRSTRPAERGEVSL